LQQPNTAITIVVPFFNEQAALAHFEGTINRVEVELGKEYDVNFVLVDDGSTDGTAERLHHMVSSRPNFAVVRHAVNRGVAAAILTGIQYATTEIVCSIDCDCSYDPQLLKRFIPALSVGVDMVTASPYHPRGAVRNVPNWRVWLSKGASSLYRLVLRNKLFTYTSCFRVYRKGAVGTLTLSNNGFVGVAELLGRLDLQGSLIREESAELNVRLFGKSKMKLVRTIFGHLRLILWLACMRARTSKSVLSRSQSKSSCNSQAATSSQREIRPTVS
jgi:glycosyltransferase involved in cell wall biosynthesis